MKLLMARIKEIEMDHEAQVRRINFAHRLIMLALAVVVLAAVLP